MCYVELLLCFYMYSYKKYLIYVFLIISSEIKLEGIQCISDDNLEESVKIK